MIPPNLYSFVNELIKSTGAGNLAWRERDFFGRETFFCEKNGYKIQIGAYWNDDAETMSISFTIEMPEGGSASFSTSQWEDDYQQMRILLELASVSSAKISPESLKGFFEG
ncbi:hypothetical protein K6979_16970 [Xanthomonas cucurbitae]|uniref:hypothetical protein n=1 Tax=Xanthomonas cucurbitae TaxID=56453 RepID=UPI0011B0082E|nr:hypothetical protein [Xanthomonas cucurbitae]WDM78798.1 hypothetical protein K6980_16975 [Xanthomonas cucurbitae]WDM82477.1 hypothetical protein K6979_16970 [Xanthomonas cucurbitae]